MTEALLKGPDWDLTSFFESFEDSQYQAFWQEMESGLKDLEAKASEVSVWFKEKKDQDLVRFFLDWQTLESRLNHVWTYAMCCSSADSSDTRATKEEHRVGVFGAQVEKFSAKMLETLKGVAESDFQRLLETPEMASMTYYLERQKQLTRWQMSLPREELAADLGVDGLSAWGQLYFQISGNLKFKMTVEGEEKLLSMSQRRSLLQDVLRSVRQEAFESGNQSWSEHEHACASAINAIAGVRHTLYRERGIEHFLDVACFDQGIERGTLDALMEAVDTMAPTAHRYLLEKAKFLKIDQMTFYDLDAPLVFADQKPSCYNWDQACTRIVEAFRKSYPDFADYVQMVFDKKWVDYSVRDNKRGGGYCCTSEWHNETRIFMTYNDTLGDIQTLAHELGHGYHGWVMRDLPAWANRYPMTLAETASTFAETLFTDALLESDEVSVYEKLEILATRLDNTSAFLLNTPMRYHFEKAFYEQRKEGFVDSKQLQSMMIEAQKRMYQPVLGEETSSYDPWFWASKLHFYITEVSFYNYPYSFGYLFSLAVCQRLKEEGPSFLKRYEALLQMTGSASAEKVAEEILGVSIGEPSFWLGAQKIIEDDLKLFQELIAKL